jgi:hypothetical protein
VLYRSGGQAGGAAWGRVARGRAVGRGEGRDSTLQQPCGGWLCGRRSRLVARGGGDCGKYLCVFVRAAAVRVCEGCEALTNALGRRGTPSPELVCGSGLACTAAYRDLKLGGESRALLCRREKECVPPASRSTHTVQPTCVHAARPPHAPSTRPASARPRSVVAAAQRPSIWNQTIWDAQAGGPGCSAHSVHLARDKSCRGALVSGTGPAASTAF